jgi:phosphoglucomutase
VRDYVDDLAAVVDLDAIRGSGLRLGVDPLGGASLSYWIELAERGGLGLEVVNDAVDPTFRFMTADHDGKIRMDCSSPYAMAGLIGMSERFDIAFATDTDADRHGIVTRSGGLMSPNHYLTAAIAYLFGNRPGWGPRCGIGKTIVSSSSIDRLAGKLGRSLREVPVGFKWFVEGLLGGELGFVGEESAGATLLRADGTAWTTDKDGPALCLLAAEITARTRQDPSRLYESLEGELGSFFYERIDVPATKAEKDALAKLSDDGLGSKDLAGEPIEAALTKAPGNGQPIGGIKVKAQSGWFAARPSGTEDVYKVYAESFRSEAHLRDIQAEAQKIVAAALVG